MTVGDFLGGGAGPVVGLTEEGQGLSDRGAVLILCDRSCTEEVMGANKAVSSFMLGTEFATRLIES